MNDKRKCLEAVQSADFAVWETRLYLDTHPCDQAAMEALRSYEKQAAEARAEYESRFGSLTGESGDCECWSWVDDPWPWNFCAN